MKFLSRLLGERKDPPSGMQATTAADHIARALSAAGLDRGGPGTTIRATIDRALASAGLQAPRAEQAPAPRQHQPSSGFRAHAPAPAATPGAGGQFLHASHANAHGRRDYRLYLPVGYDAADAPRPLIVMLHGCTQSAEDFAVGTRMNALADAHGFLVAYPQQAGNANHAKCWNWFRPEDQRGEAGEPSILMGIVDQVAQAYRVDRGRVFVAGLSAGAAMAVILARTHPQHVRAIGVHSGLPYASAHDMPSAFAAMQGRGALPAPSAASNPIDVPMIIFHGDADRTVAPRNADAIAAQAQRPGPGPHVETGRAPGGQSWTRRISRDGADRRWLESWTVHGAGHAWSGGDPAGSYTDPNGPDASAAMVEFFLHQG